MLLIYSNRRWSHTGRRAAHDTRTASSWPARTSHKDKLRRQTMARRSTAGATELLARAVEITAPSTLAIIAGSPGTRPRSPASRATPLGWRQQSWHVASRRHRTGRLGEPARALKVINQLAHT
jgi:hypothetical protein